MERNPSNLKELLEQGLAELAMLPAKNDFLLTNNELDLQKLDSLDGYYVFMIAHDYDAKTPIMLNSLYEKFGFNLRNITIIVNPENLKIATQALKQDEKCFIGARGVGLKERTDILDKLVPEDLKSSNIVIKINKEWVGYNTDSKGFFMSLKKKFSEIGKDIKGSNLIIFGAGGVAKEVARQAVRESVNRIVILNRTSSKAEEIADELNQEHKQIAFGGGEDLIEEQVLTKIIKPDAIINLTDKGSDGKLEDYSAFAEVNEDNEKKSIEVLKKLKVINPDVVIADIVLPKSRKSKTLKLCEEVGLKNLLDGIPMVVNQAVPAYMMAQENYPELHPKKLTEEEVLNIFKRATGIQ
jgi:shikimate 5-dehydrogenase